MATPCAAAASGGLVCCFWKQDRHSTGLPCVGLKGTVVSVPHSEHVVRVSGRTRCAPRVRFALHCLQCLGSFLNCLSWKNSCSPAVNTNSAPQSTHLRTRSVNSMANLPHRNHTEIGRGSMTNLPVSGSLSLRFDNKGPDRAKDLAENELIQCTRLQKASTPPACRAAIRFSGFSREFRLRAADRRG